MARLITIAALLAAIIFPFTLMAAPEDAIQEVNLYSSSKEHLIRPILEAFEKESGVTVNLTTLDSAALLSRVRLEGEDTLADALIVADVARLSGLREKGLLLPVRLPQVQAAIPANLRASDDSWVGVATRARLVFRRADDKAASITDYRSLAENAWRGELLIRSSDSVYNQSLLADLIHRFGEEVAQDWAKGVVRNMAQKPAGGDRDQLRALASGKGRLAVANSYYYGMMLSSADITDRNYAKALVPMFAAQTPGGGTHVNIRGVAIAKHAKNPEVAEKLIAFFASDKAQEMLTEFNHEYPANPKIAASALLRSFGPRPKANVPLEAIGELNARTIELFSRADWQ